MHLRAFYEALWIASTSTDSAQEKLTHSGITLKYGLINAQSRAPSASLS